ncbi:thermonuclease family protein [Altererythrobacter aerius]|uniref:Thermonuclease family protein n=2 Tax=Sphingomonadales TaxID=204457 RepID=A0A6I4TFF0_9SPHN|nr:thermonuclease family protein [Tsuneonella aeria]QDM41342.1 thermonuclease family protein [Altererythrobacter sp. TH136]
MASLKLIAGGLGAGVALGLSIISWPAISGSLWSSSRSPAFAVCGLMGGNCVIDGDTFHLDGVKIRIADIDTPELKGRCDWEIQKAQEARDRLAVLLSEGPFELQPISDRDEDQYGRKLRVVTRDGRSLGDQLVSERLARTWTGRREPWC